MYPWNYKPLQDVNNKDDVFVHKLFSLQKPLPGGMIQLNADISQPTKILVHAIPVIYFCT